MLKDRKYVIFKVPEAYDSEQEVVEGKIPKKFLQGSYNKKLVIDILKYNGFAPTTDEDYNIAWLSSPEVDQLMNYSKLQKINHFPYSKKILGNKAELTEIIQNNRNIDMFDYFFPKSYVLPKDRDLLYRVMKANPRKQFIAKPPNGSCGHGIKIVTFNEFYSIQQGSVVCEYISHPLCIDGFKFDLRIYVLVTSWAPLRAFICKEGLARFATESYSTVTENPYSHLTNATLNKHGRNWSNDFKWKLSELLNEVNHRYKRTQAELMSSIIAVVSQALALAQPNMVPDKVYGVDHPFFELYGFDVLFDRNYNPYLLEINTYPSLCISEDADYDVKAPMIAQAMSISGIPDASYEYITNEENYIRITEDQFDEIQQEIIKGEDERNELSGNGYIRIFPSDINSDLEPILVKPKFVPERAPKPHTKKSEALDPREIGHSFQAKQSIDLLAAYLESLEIKYNSNELSKRKRICIENFLMAQGYHVTRGESFQVQLKNFIDRSNGWVNLMQSGKKIPPKVKAKIIENGDDFVGQILLNAKLRRVKEIETLFM